MKRFIRSAMACAVLTVALVTSSGCVAERAGYDEVKLKYAAGPTSVREFKECWGPGTTGDVVYNDSVFTLPTTLRSWAIQKEGGDSNTPIDSGTKPGPDNQPGPHVKVYLTTDFYINTNCGQKDNDENAPLPQFWQNIASRGWGPDNKPLTTDGEPTMNMDSWKAILQNTLVNTEQKVLARGTRFYTADALDANANGEREELERRLAPFFQSQLRAKMGGDYFCGVGFKRGEDVTWTELVPDGTEPDGRPKVREQQKTGPCPPLRISIIDVDFADKAIGEARAKVYAAEQEAKAKLIAAQAELDRAKKLGEAARDANYLRYKTIEAQMAAAEACRANPNCTVIVDGTGGAGVNVGGSK